MSTEGLHIFSDWATPLAHLNVIVRASVAALAGGIIGLQRESQGKAAGLRTHILTALAASLLVSITQVAEFATDAESRVIQGILTGVGFMGAGTILKRDSEESIRGLTTSASLWATTAIGIGYALGTFWLPTFATFATLITLALLGRLEHKQNGERDERQNHLLSQSDVAGPDRPLDA